MIKILLFLLNIVSSLQFQNIFKIMQYKYHLYKDMNTYKSIYEYSNILTNHNIITYISLKNDKSNLITEFKFEPNIYKIISEIKKSSNFNFKELNITNSYLCFEATVPNKYNFYKTIIFYNINFILNARIIVEDTIDKQYIFHDFYNNISKNNIDLKYDVLNFEEYCILEPQNYCN